MAILIIATTWLGACVEPEITVREVSYTNDKIDQARRPFPICILPDAVVTKISITNVSGNTLTYDFTVGNIGVSPLPLPEMYFQTWLSEDPVFDGSDVPAGGAIFGNNAPTLGHHESYTRSWSYGGNGVNLTQYRYVVVQVVPLHNASLAECSTSNNTHVQDIGCNLSDLYVSGFKLKSISYATNTMQYDFTVTNAGWAPLDLGDMAFQAYLSKNTTYELTDPPAGGSVFFSPTPVLQKGESFTQSWGYGPPSAVSLSIYRYLIIFIEPLPGTNVQECNTADNMFVVDIGPLFTL